MAIKSVAKKLATPVLLSHCERRQSRIATRCYNIRFSVSTTRQKLYRVNLDEIDIVVVFTHAIWIFEGNRELHEIQLLKPG